jgi:hypothetical protein
MKCNVKRLAILAAAGATMGVAATASSASAAITPAAPFKLAAPFNLGGFGGGGGFGGAGAYPLPDLTSFTPGALAFAGPKVGGISTAIGPTIITTAPGGVITFNNTTNQVSAGGLQNATSVGP